MKKLELCQSINLNEELSFKLIKNGFESKNTYNFTKIPYFKPKFQMNEQQKFLTIFNFRNSQINQQEIDQLAELLLKYSIVYATSKFDVGKVHSSLHLHLQFDADFKKQRVSKIPIHLQDRVNRFY